MESYIILFNYNGHEWTFKAESWCCFHIDVNLICVFFGGKFLSITVSTRWLWEWHRDSPGEKSGLNLSMSSSVSRELRTELEPELLRGVPLDVVLSSWARHFRPPDPGMFQVDHANYDLSKQWIIMMNSWVMIGRHLAGTSCVPWWWSTTPGPHSGAPVLQALRWAFWVRWRWSQMNCGLNWVSWPFIPSCFAFGNVSEAFLQDQWWYSSTNFALHNMMKSWSKRVYLDSQDFWTIHASSPFSGLIDISVVFGVLSFA